MNTRAVLMLLAFLGWSWYTWSWLNDKKQECCPTTMVSADVPAAPNAGPANVVTNNLPLSFGWGSNQPVQGNGYAAYIKDK